MDDFPQVKAITIEKLEKMMMNQLDSYENHCLVGLSILFLNPQKWLDNPNWLMISGMGLKSPGWFFNTCTQPEPHLTSSHHDCGDLRVSKRSTH